jgi:hypothetical protein
LGLEYGQEFGREADKRRATLALLVMFGIGFGYFALVGREASEPAIPQPGR